MVDIVPGTGVVVGLRRRRSEDAARAGRSRASRTAAAGRQAVARRSTPGVTGVAASGASDVWPRRSAHVRWRVVARYVDIHPENPQPRLLQQVVDALRDDALIAYPTDSGYALGCRIGNRDGRDRILRIRGLDERHHFTLVCKDFSQLGQLVHVDNAAFRAIRAATPGPYTFILPATPEVPRRLLHPRKRTVGVRIPDHAVVHALLDLLGEPLLTSTLILPGETEPRTHGLGDQGGARPRRRPRRRRRGDAGRADHGRRLVRGRARGAAGRRRRPGALRRLRRRDASRAGSANRSRIARQARHRP